MTSTSGLRFGTSGLRDTVERMTDLECYVATRGFLDYLSSINKFTSNMKVPIAGDLRPSTRRIRRAVALAIRDSGGIVDDQSLASSPALCLYALNRGIPSIMVTGSHIPADRNGIKFTMPDGEVMKSDESEILNCIESQRKKLPLLFSNDGKFLPEIEKEAERLLWHSEELRSADFEYCERYISFFGKCLSEIKMFFYQHSAVGRSAVTNIFSALSAELFASPKSDDFVPIDTESVSKNTLDIFRKVMDEEGIDIGITIDGDSDRPLLVYRELDGTITHLTGDILGLLSVIALRHFGVKINSVVVPISANDAIQKKLESEGISVHATKIGSPYVIAEMNKEIANGKNSVAWESNGGFILGTDIFLNGSKLRALPTRDSMLPLILTLSYAKYIEKSIYQIVSELPMRFTAADLIKNFPNEKGRAVIESLMHERLKRVLHNAGLITSIQNINYLDGVRILFENGEVMHFRPSGNAPEFRCYAVADSKKRAEEIVEFGLKKVIPLLIED